MRYGPHFLAALMTLCSSAPAQDVDLALTPGSQIVTIGDTVEVQLFALASGTQNIDFAAIDALLDYDPNFLLLTGVDDTNATENWFASSFLPDPDGINNSIADGDAIYTALSAPGIPAVAPPAGTLVTTLQFVALQETLGTPVSFLPAMGVFGSTAVYSYHQAGVELTGDINSVAMVRVIAPPTQFCLGEPSACPCSNPGGFGAGCQNSTGLGAILSSSGSTSVSADDLVLHASQLPAHNFSIFIIGGGAQNLLFGDGLLCVSPGPSGLHRFSPPQQSDLSGSVDRGPGIVAYTNGFPAGQEIQVGNTYYFQTWFRDSSGPCSFGWNLTNGLEVTFTP